MQLTMHARRTASVGSAKSTAWFLLGIEMGKLQENASHSRPHLVKGALALLLWMVHWVSIIIGHKQYSLLS